VASAVVQSLVGGAPVPTDHLTLSAARTDTAGSVLTLTAMAVSPGGSADAAYTGTIHFTTSDAQGALPTDYTFTAADKGVHVFSITLRTAGSQSITARDTSLSAVTGTLSGITVSPAAASRFVMSAIGQPATAGSPVSVTLTALDPYGNVATGYAQTVHFTSTDAAASLPAYTFSSADQGVHTFSVTFKTPGTQSLTVVDGAGLTATQSGIAVNPTAPLGLTATAVSGGEIDLSWTAATGATGYTIQVNPGGVSGWSPVATVAAGVTTFNVTGLAAGTIYDFRVIATAGSLSSTASNVAVATTSGTDPAGAGDTLWSSSYTPPVNAYSSGSYEVGVRFVASTSGTVTGARFYKESWMGGVLHVGHLWSSSGALLATAAFTNETYSGWQQVKFATPVAIAANQVYIVSFSTGGGYFGITTSYFNYGGVTRGPLAALPNSIFSSNGVYHAGLGVFPSVGSSGMNFWSDVVFSPSASSSAILGGGDAAESTSAPGGSATVFIDAAGSSEGSSASTAGQPTREKATATARSAWAARGTVTISPSQPSGWHRFWGTQV
jgi:hypothetical protein